MSWRAEQITMTQGRLVWSLTFGSLIGATLFLTLGLLFTAFLGRLTTEPIVALVALFAMRMAIELMERVIFYVRRSRRWRRIHVPYKAYFRQD